MKKPQTPPSITDLLARGPQALPDVAAMAERLPNGSPYLHWDELRHRPLPDGFASHLEWWAATKLARLAAMQPVPLMDQKGQPFRFAVPPLIAEQLHRIDRDAGSTIKVPSPLTLNDRDQYIMRSLMEEAITSSQLEGAATTREVAKDMLRTAREPRDRHERMILNNYLTMKRIRELQDQPLTPALVLEIHRLVTADTLDDPQAAGRLRKPGEHRVVADFEGEVYHSPPVSEQLPQRMEALCAFANGQTPSFFVHPLIRSIIIHFWLAYDHPFVDGNGRTARALFYWSILHARYWLFEFLSVSAELRKAPVQYARAFLYTETDQNDLTYFIVAQVEVIARAIAELNDYITRKTRDKLQLQQQLRGLAELNHRQRDLVRDAIEHPGRYYTIAGHQQIHATAYQTARTDLLHLAQRGLLQQRSRGKKMLFTPPADLVERLRQLTDDD